MHEWLGENVFAIRQQQAIVTKTEGSFLLTTIRESRRSSAGDDQVTDHWPTILCIDDDPDIIAAIEVVLSQYKVNLLCSYSGEQGIWESICKKPDLIITDWLMPQGSGEELVLTLKSNPFTADIPIIVASCLGGEKMRHRLSMMDVTGFIKKPLRKRELLSEIGYHIDVTPHRPTSTDTTVDVTDEWREENQENSN